MSLFLYVAVKFILIRLATDDTLPLATARASDSSLCTTLRMLQITLIEWLIDILLWVKLRLQDINDFILKLAGESQYVDIMLIAVVVFCVVGNCQAVVWVGS